MALPKSIKIGGAYYKGYNIPVASAAGSYVIYLEDITGAALNSLSLTPDQYGCGDSISIAHFSEKSGGGNCLAILGENIYNMGKGTSINLDFPAAERIATGESIKLTYINTASMAMNVYVLAEYIGVRKTS